MAKQAQRTEKLRGMSDKDLASELETQQKELRELRFDIAGSKSSDTGQKRTARRDVARIKTERRRRELGR